MRYLLFALLLVLAASFVPVEAQAQAQAQSQSAFGFVQIVPDICDCENTAPAFGCVMQVLQNVIRVLIAISFVMATLALMYAGFVWMTSGGNAERRSTGKNLLLNVIVGIVVILMAWLIVDFVMKTFSDEAKFGPWHDILAAQGESAAVCLEKRDQVAITEGTVDFSVVTATGSDGSMGGARGGARRQGAVALQGGCTGNGTNASCVQLGPEVSCKGNNCRVDAGLKGALAAIPDRLGDENFSWTVTEGYPPSVPHQAACHSNGTCVDVGLRPKNYTIENIAHFFNAAKAQGLSPVLETRDCDLAARVRSNGGQALCGNWETHFSVYGR